jgi:hypothetical protein
MILKDVNLALIKITAWQVQIDLFIVQVNLSKRRIFFGPERSLLLHAWPVSSFCLLQL